MRTLIGLALGALVLASGAAAAEPPPVEVLPPVAVPAPAPVAPPISPPGNPFPPASAPGVAAPPFCPPPAAPERRRLFHGRLRERVRALLHLGGCP